MSGFLSLFDEHERVEVHPGYWVELRKTLSKEDYDAAQRALFLRETVEQNTANPTGGYRGETDTVAYQTELVARSIISWNLTDKLGEPLPCDTLDQTKVSLARLPQFIFNRLFVPVNDWNNPEAEASPKSDGGADRVAERAADRNGDESLARPVHAGAGVVDEAGAD